MRAKLLLCAVAATALFVGCGGDDDGIDEEAAEILRGALTKDSPDIQSANSRLNLTGSLGGEQGGDFDLSLAGPVEFGSGGQPGALDWTVQAQADIPLLQTLIGIGEVDFDGGLTLADGKLFVTYQDTTYEADAATSRQFAPALEGSLDPTATAGLPDEDADKFIEAFSDLQNEGSEDVAGEETTHISGVLDPAALEDLSGGDTPLQIEGLDTVDFDIWIAESDDIARRVEVAADVPIPEDVQAFLPIDSVDFALTSEISDLNAADAVETPTGTKPLSDLLGELGIDPSSFQIPGLGAGSTSVPDIGTPGGAANDPDTQACIDAAPAGDADAILDCLNQ